MRSLVPLFLAALLLAACGGGRNASTPTTNSTAADQARIKSAYQKFFSGRAPVPARVAVLQNGPRFKGLVTSFASNPLAKNANVTVSSVKLLNANNAEVVYTVKLGGTGLPKQTGTAVKENGVWKVGDASLCKLVALQGSTPSVCKS